MEPEINQTESQLAPLQKESPLSKYLAMALFIIMPFLGGWIGYTYAPEKVMEIENDTKFESIVDNKEMQQDAELNTYNDSAQKFDQSFSGKQILEDVQYGKFVDIDPAKYPIDDTLLLTTLTASYGATFPVDVEFYARKARKVSENLSLVMVGTTGGGLAVGVVLYDEIQRKMINLVDYPYLPYTVDLVDAPMTKWVTNSTLVTVDFGHKGTGTPSRLVLHDFVQQEKIILYEEKDLGVGFASGCEMECFGNLSITADGNLLVDRYQYIPGSTQGKFLETISVPIPDPYLSEVIMSTRE